MILRVFAIYERNRYIFAFLIVLWFIQIVISAVGLHTGFGMSRTYFFRPNLQMFVFQLFHSHLDSQVLNLT